MKTVTSKDGTAVAYEQLGSGPPLVLVDGAWCHRTFGPMPKLAPLLAEHFTVVHYDRRGRGATADPQPYAVEREIEALQALVGALGGAAAMYGTSSGAVLAARATAAGVGVTQLALYEPPLALDGTHQPQPPDYIAQIESNIARGAHGDAAKVFMRAVGVPAIGILFMRLIPSVWRNMITVAPTVMHDFAVLGDTQRGGPMPAELAQTLAKIQVPTTVMAGGKSPAWMHHAMNTVAAGIRGARTRVVPGQDHNAAAKAIAPVLVEVLGKPVQGRAAA